MNSEHCIFIDLRLLMQMVLYSLRTLLPKTDYVFFFVGKGFPDRSFYLVEYDKLSWFFFQCSQCKWLEECLLAEKSVLKKSNSVFNENIPTQMF